jgi:hypothetical protein
MGQGRHLGVLGVVALVLSTAACTCSSDGTGTGGGAGGGSGGGGGGATLREDCLLDSEQPTAALIEAAYTDLVVNAREGTSEAPLTPKGCMFARRTVTGGKVTAFALMRYLGYEGALLPLDGGFENVTEAPIARWTIDLNGTTLGELDDDENQVIDTQTTEVVDSAGVLQSYVRTSWDAQAFSTPVLKDRFTLTRVGADRLSLRQERAATGGTEVVRAFEFPQKQHACLDGTGPDTDVMCGPADKEIVTTLTMLAMEKGMTCMAKQSQPMGAQLAEAFGKLMSRGFNLGCYTGGESEASVDTGVYNANGTIQLYVNRGLLECDGSRQMRTIFHEFMHLVQGGHDPYDDIEKPGPKAYTYSDPVRACESLCFDDLPTKCTCAACLGVKTCDPRCTNMDSCVVRPNDGGVATMSEAVGAECRNPAYTGATGSSAGTWHLTMMECNSMCSYGAFNCKSKSVSCDPTCN